VQLRHLLFVRSYPDRQVMHTSSMEQVEQFEILQVTQVLELRPGYNWASFRIENEHLLQTFSSEHSRQSVMSQRTHEPRLL
jgi:hypothetical protein